MVTFELIVTQWDVKSDIIEDLAGMSLELIVTQWDVKAIIGTHGATGQTELIVTQWDVKFLNKCSISKRFSN